MAAQCGQGKVSVPYGGFNQHTGHVAPPKPVHQCTGDWWWDEAACTWRWGNPLAGAAYEGNCPGHPGYLDMLTHWCYIPKPTQAPHWSSCGGPGTVVEAPPSEGGDIPPSKGKREPCVINAKGDCVDPATGGRDRGSTPVYDDPIVWPDPGLIPAPSIGDPYEEPVSTPINGASPFPLDDLDPMAWPVGGVPGGHEPQSVADPHGGAGAIFLPDVTPPNGIGLGGYPLGHTVLSSQG